VIEAVVIDGTRLIETDVQPDAVVRSLSELPEALEVVDRSLSG
jgi:hypothetical protein